MKKLIIAILLLLGGLANAQEKKTTITVGITGGLDWNHKYGGSFGFETGLLTFVNTPYEKIQFMNQNSVVLEGIDLGNGNIFAPGVLLENGILLNNSFFMLGRVKLGFAIKSLKDYQQNPFHVDLGLGIGGKIQLTQGFLLISSAMDYQFFTQNGKTNLNSLPIANMVGQFHLEILKISYGF